MMSRGHLYELSSKLSNVAVLNIAVKYTLIALRKCLVVKCTPRPLRLILMNMQ